MITHTLKITSQPIRTVLALSLALLVSACGDSGDGITHPWYSNGFIISKVELKNSTGELLIVTHCEWSEEQRTSTCIDTDFTASGIDTGYTVVRYYNADGRIARETQKEGSSDEIHTDDTYTYQSGRLIQLSEFWTGDSDPFLTSTYSWQDGNVASVSHYNGTLANPTQTLVSRDIVISELNKIVRIEPDTSVQPLAQYDRALSYELDSNIRVSKAIDYLWDASNEAWVQDNEHAEYRYDRNGNIERVDFVTDIGGVEGIASIEHQYIGRVIENESLTIGIEPY